MWRPFGISMSKCALAFILSGSIGACSSHRQQSVVTTTAGKRIVERYDRDDPQDVAAKLLLLSRSNRPKERLDAAQLFGVVFNLAARDRYENVLQNLLLDSDTAVTLEALDAMHEYAPLFRSLKPIILKLSESRNTRISEKAKVILSLWKL
jgi:hypothetical protein